MNRPAQDDVAALETLAERLQGFGSDLQVEWLDGALTAVAAGPYQPNLAQWLGELLGEEFERAYADPADVAVAHDVVARRLAALRRMLDADRLMDDPDHLHLAPLLYDWAPGEKDDMGEGEGAPEDAASAADGGDADAEQALAEQAMLQGGALWADGFLSAVSMFPDIWAEPATAEARDVLRELLGDIQALLAPTPEDAPVPAATGDEPPPTPREAAIDRALFAAQDLRLFWLDHAPKPATRRVEAAPGRNDPCPCGSGRKFKKCHGAAA